MRIRSSDRFDDTLKAEGITPYRLLLQSPLMNAHIERWTKSLKAECLDYFIPLGTHHLDHIIGEYVEYYHFERPHQGLGNNLITPNAPPLDEVISSAPVDLAGCYGLFIAQHDLLNCQRDDDATEMMSCTHAPDLLQFHADRYPLRSPDANQSSESSQRTHQKRG